MVLILGFVQRAKQTSHPNERGQPGTRANAHSRPFSGFVIAHGRGSLLTIGLSRGRGLFGGRFFMRDVWLREAKASGRKRTTEVFPTGREGAGAGGCAWLGDGPRFWRSSPVGGFAMSGCELSSFAGREFGRLRVFCGRWSPSVACRSRALDPTTMLRRFSQIIPLAGRGSSLTLGKTSRRNHAKDPHKS